ncbi:MAG: glycosyltransferase family 4 protein [Gelidibacter sp.]
MNTPRKHIIIVTSEFPPQPGGIGNHAYNLANQLAQNNFKVSVIADQRSFLGVEEKKFDTDLDFEVHRIRKKQIRGVMYLERLMKLIDLVDTADIVIASGKFSLWNVAFCSLFKKKIYIAVVHGTEVNFKNFFVNRSIELSLKRFKVIIAVSNYTKSLIQHLNLPIKVIPNGYDSNKWSKHVAPFQNLKGSPKLITIGNVTLRKGQLNVISHLPLLRLKYPNIHYHCIGLPTEAEDFLKKAKELSVENHITFHGRLDDIEMQRMLLASDIFAMLSEETATGDVEGFGIAVIEANALGVPGIGSYGSGLEDAINDKKTGFLVPSNNSEAFLKSIDEILKDREAFSRACIGWASRHEWKSIIKSYIAVILNR